MGWGRLPALLQSEPLRQESLSHAVPWHDFVWRALTRKANIRSPPFPLPWQGPLLCLEARKPQVSVLPHSLPPVPALPLPALPALSPGQAGWGMDLGKGVHESPEGSPGQAPGSTDDV